MPKKRLGPVFWRTAQRVIREINIPPSEWEGEGFTDLMLNKNHSIEEMASWLGHKSIKQTWESYKNRWELTYKNVG